MSIDNRPDDPRYNASAEPMASPNSSTSGSPVDPWAAVPPQAEYSAGAPYVPGPFPGAPNPSLAGLLGFIPGVGAMYNGQFAKGLAHIAIFAVFCSLSKNVNGIFGLLVAGWVFYMAFEAYQTAIARRDGLPLPDPFGLNSIGERLGFRSTPGAAAHRPYSAPFPQPSHTQPGQTGYGSSAGAYTQADASGRPAGYQVDPAGNVFRSAPGEAWQQTPSQPPVRPTEPYPGYPTPQPVYTAGQGYEEPVPPYADYPVPPMPPMPPVSGSGLPSGALWLIGLGLFALLGSIRAFDFLEGEATGGLFLIGLSVFLLWRRWNVIRILQPVDGSAAWWSLLQTSRGAGVLFIVGLLTLLQGLHIVRWQNSWPLLLIFLGVFLLVERLALNRVTAPIGGNAYPAQPYAAPVEPVAEQSHSTSILPRYTRPADDRTKTEGQ